jgi:hypothetical protein
MHATRRVAALGGVSYDHCMPAAQRQKAIDRVSSDVSAAFGARLVCLALYGSGVGQDFNPRASDLNFAIVLDRVDVGDLRRFHHWLPAWHRLGVATPLLIDRDFLRRARDVFPIELEDIRGAHRILAGEDVFSGIEVAAEDLRRELEQEARGKLLRLCVGYAETGGRKRDIEELMVQSVKSFAVIMRGVLRLRTGDAPPGLELTIASFEQSSAQEFPAMLRAARVKLATAAWDGDAESRFAAYLCEVERLVGVVDQLYDSASKPGDDARL